MLSGKRNRPPRIATVRRRYDVLVTANDSAFKFDQKATFGQSASVSPSCSPDFLTRERPPVDKKHQHLQFMKLPPSTLRNLARGASTKQSQNLSIILISDPDSLEDPPHTLTLTSETQTSGAIGAVTPLIPCKPLSASVFKPFTP